MTRIPAPSFRAFVGLLLTLLLPACIETPRRSGITDSLGQVSFAVPPQARGAGTEPDQAAPAGQSGSPLSRPEIYGGAPRRSVAPGRAGAQVGGEGVTLNFDRADVREVVKVILGDVLGRTYSIQPQVAGEVTLASTAPIPRGDLLNVLESALRGNGATLVDLGGGSYQVVPLENAPARAEITPLGGRAPVVRPGYGISVVPLRNISANAAAQFVQPIVASPEDIRIDTARNLLLFSGSGNERQAVVDILADLDVNWLADKSVGIFPLQLASPEAVIPELTSIFGSVDPASADTQLIRFLPLARLNAILAVGTDPQQIQEVERWIARLDRGQTVGTQFYVYNLKHAVAEDIAKTINEIYSDAPAGTSGLGAAPLGPAALAPPTSDGGSEGTESDGSETPASPQSSEPPSGPPGGVKVVANKANNSLLIRATPPVYALIESTLRRLDTAPLQVLIEATIVEVALNDALRYGVQYYIQANNFGVGFNSGAGSGDFGIEPAGQIPGFNFIFTGGGSNITIDALSRLTDVKVLSSPSVVVQDNSEAELTVGDEVPIVTRQAQSVEADPLAPTLNSIEYRNTGVILKVKPRINVNGVVSLDIAQEVSRVADVAQGAEDTLTPTITQRKITSRVNVQSAQTIALGGLIQDSETRGRDRIPILGEIPVIGGLFGTTNIVDQRTELIVFITPRVIRNAEDARDVSEELRARLRSLRPFSAEPALPPVPQPGRVVLPPPPPAPPPSSDPAGPVVLVPPGTLGQAEPQLTGEEAKRALAAGVPAAWLPELAQGGAPPTPEPRPVTVATAPMLPPVPSARAGFDIARAPVPSERPVASVPAPPVPRPAPPGG